MWWFYILTLPLFIIRGLRWLAIVQQKEYRLDRLRIFLQSAEGRQDFWTLLPPVKWLSRTGLKRPVLTSRILVVALIAASLFLVELILINLISSMGWVALIWTINYLCLPLILGLSLFPTVLVARVMTNFYLNQAHQKLAVDRPLIIGITGSYGKTSTKLLIAHLLAAKYSVFCTPKSYNTRFSVAKAILDHYHHQQIAVIEYAAYTQGEIKILANYFVPQLAVITGLSPQHLELFGSLENIILAKSELIKALPANAPVFCNAADPGAIKICEAGQAKQVIAYSGPASVVELKHVGLTNQGNLTFVWRGHTIVTNLIGLHYQSNVAGAMAVAERLDVSELSIVQALQSFQPPASFTRTVPGVRHSLIIDDGGTTNPTGFNSALQLIKVFHQQGRQTVLVTAGIIDLGAQSSAIHQQLAQQAKTYVDEVWYLGQVGLAEFKVEFGGHIFTDREAILKRLKIINHQTAILIEGRVPKWMRVIYANF